MKRTLIANKLGVPQCHASNIIITEKSNSKIVAFFAGSSEGSPDTAIWWVAGKDNVWSVPTCLAKLGYLPHWNPVLFEKNNQIYLYFKTGILPSNWTTHCIQITKPESIQTIPNLNGVARGPVRSHILPLSNGELLAPASHEVVISKGSMFERPTVVWDAFVDRSNDGISWEKTPYIPYDRKRYGKYGGVIQPTLWESKKGHVHMLLRSTIGKICRSDSNDFGKSWTPIEPTDLPNNNSGIDVSLHPNSGILAMVYNPVGDDWGPRTPISVAFSRDDGRVWSDPVHIESGYGSFSYPSITPTGNGFAVTYTWNRLNIAYIEFEVKETKSGFSTDIESVVNENL